VLLFRVEPVHILCVRPAEFLLKMMRLSALWNTDLVPVVTVSSVLGFP
jgi:hypothetical protein